MKTIDGDKLRMDRNKITLKMTSQEIGIVLQLIGLIIFILAFIVDFIGLGVYPGCGYKQITGLIVGAIAINAGDRLKRLKKSFSLITSIKGIEIY